ncbi:hypothetical protein RB195_003488 [Necator americanus]|uniref:Phorbol-ester/DAG-type domain-containing protein n=2 Tax=Necator americanus TaxID=51031 RepID=A0ABR1DQ53_NECAM
MTDLESKRREARSTWNRYGPSLTAAVNGGSTDPSNRLRSKAPLRAQPPTQLQRDSCFFDPTVLCLKCPTVDARLDRPAMASVLRAESDRVPQVLISQPSTELRRTRSESQLDTKLLDAISVNSSTSGGLEDEIISVYTMSSLGSEPTNEIELPTLEGLEDQNGLLTPSVLTPREKDATLTPGMSLADVEREAAAATAAASASTALTVHPATNGSTALESASSVASSLSLKTEDEMEEEGSLSRSRPTSTRKQRLHATLQASKRRVLDLMQKRRPVTPGSGTDTAEMGADAGEIDGCAEVDRGDSPLPSAGKRSPIETQVIDKKEKRKKSKNRSPGAGQDKSTPSLQDSPTASLGSIRSRTTKSVHFRENVLWGQSLHYDLDGSSSASPSKSSCKYLNVTVHAKEVPLAPPAPVIDASSPTSSTAPLLETEPPKPILLGYTSLYIPQILDDCQLTLSNCHREVYQLRPPTDVQSISEPSTQEFSRHAGYDPRLLYGDVTLGFRYFPGGLPHGAGTFPGEESEEEMRVEESVDGKARIVSQLLGSPAIHHDWKPWTSKSGSAICAMCRGKIWLKSASCCQRCLVVCHHKCVDRAATGIACTAHPISQADTQFAELDVDANVNEDHTNECPTTVIPATPQTTQPPLRGEDVELTSRRSRLRSKMTEKFTSWRKSGKTTSKLDLDLATNRDSRCSDSSASAAAERDEALSPMASIQDCLADVLPTLDGSPFIRSLYFQPGNAYNEQTINHAKLLGKEIFSNLKGEERKSKINEQIDRIQLAIRETKDGRLAALKKDGSTKKAGSTFEGLDERLQALAVLMLHYCAALQDCESHDQEQSSSAVTNNNGSSLPETPSEGRSFSRFVTKFRRKMSTQHAVLRKQVARSLHKFDIANSLLTNISNGSDQINDAVVEFESINQNADEEELIATTTQEDLNRAFIVMSEGPDIRNE